MGFNSGFIGLKSEHIIMNPLWHLSSRGARGGAVGCGTALQAGGSRVRFLMVPLGQFTDLILPVALWPWCGLEL